MKSTTINDQCFECYGDENDDHFGTIDECEKWPPIDPEFEFDASVVSSRPVQYVSPAPASIYSLIIVSRKLEYDSNLANQMKTAEDEFNYKYNQIQSSFDALDHTIGELSKKMFELEQDLLLCSICCSKPRSTCFLPCGHICCCLECTKKLYNCPYCRTKVTENYVNVGIPSYQTRITSSFRDEYIDETLKMKFSNQGCNMFKILQAFQFVNPEIMKETINKIHVSRLKWFNDYLREMLETLQRLEVKRRNELTLCENVSKFLERGHFLCITCQRNSRNWFSLCCGYFEYCSECAEKRTVCPGCQHCTTGLIVSFC